MHLFPFQILIDPWQQKIEKINQFTNAENNYLQIISLNKDDILADDAHYYLAELYLIKLNNPGKAKEYYLENIKKVRVSVPKANSFQAAWENSPWIRGGERIEFDYLGKTIRFGRKLNQQDSKLLFQLLTKRLEDQLKKKK